MVTPGVVKSTLEITKTNPDALVHFPSVHLGNQLQNESILNGYDEVYEDQLLDAIDWQKDGYSLFKISNASGYAYRIFAAARESNCFAIKTDQLKVLGKYNPQFQTAGGGYANIELFRRIVHANPASVYHVIGEATFHQIHGGTTSNHARTTSQINEFTQEFHEISGEAPLPPPYEPNYYGVLRKEVKPLLFERNYPAQHLLSAELANRGEADASASILDTLYEKQLNDPFTALHKGISLLQSGKAEQAIAHLESVLDEMGPFSPKLYLTLGNAYKQLGELTEAKKRFTQIFDISINDPQAYLQLGLLCEQEGHQEGHIEDAIAHLEKATQYDEHGTAGYFYHLGRLYALADHNQQAYNSFQEAVRLDLMQHRANLRLGIWASKKGDQDTALKHLRRTSFQAMSNRYSEKLYIVLMHEFIKLDSQKDARMVAQRGARLYPQSNVLNNYLVDTLPSEI